MLIAEALRGGLLLYVVLFFYFVVAVAVFKYKVEVLINDCNLFNSSNLCVVFMILKNNIQHLTTSFFSISKESKSEIHFSHMADV
ncbi:hypothetical protein FlaCF_2204 [Flavobacterium tructae]